MARIRSIKPEFFDSPSTAKASPYARLLYIAMWCWADDWGIGDANPRRLLSFAFPSDGTSEVEPRNFRRLASEVAETYGVQWYEHDGREYYAIPSWEEHQRTEKKAKRRNPGPDQAERFLYSEVSEVPTPSVGGSDVGKGKGERGKGNRGSTTGAAARRSAPLPADFRPSPEHMHRAAETGLDLLRELTKFQAHAEEKGRTAENWNAAFTRWLINAAEYAQRDQRTGSKRPTTDDRVREGLALARRLDQDDQLDIPQIGA